MTERSRRGRDGQVKSRIIHTGHQSGIFLGCLLLETVKVINKDYMDAKTFDEKQHHMETGAPTNENRIDLT